MTDQEYDPFVKEFTRLTHALDPYTRKPEAIHAKADAYFHALKRLPLAEVTAKADAWLATQSKFPKPADWSAQIVPRQTRELHVLTEAESREHREAERCGYEGDPCGCALCIHAGVTEKPIRFVPEFDRDERDIRVRDGNRIVTAGHWAHGSELARWYQARADFWNRCYELGLMTAQQKTKADKVPFAKRLEEIFATLDGPTRPKTEPNS